jgi:hypothetical protein
MQLVLILVALGVARRFAEFFFRSEGFSAGIVRGAPFSWAPFSPVAHFYLVLFLVFKVYCLRRLFVSVKIRSITWFDLVVLVPWVAAALDVYQDWSSVTSGETLWRVTGLLVIAVLHCRINNVPFLRDQQTHAAQLWSAPPRRGALIWVAGLMFRTAGDRSPDPDQAGQTDSMNGKTGPGNSWRFWTLLAGLLSVYPYGFVVQKLDLNPVAAFVNKGASITTTGLFGSVYWIDDSHADHELTDADLIYLRRMTCLKKLDLHGEGITDIGLGCLEGLARLKVLRLHGTQVTDGAAAKLKEALPNCQIEVRQRSSRGSSGLKIF